VLDGDLDPHALRGNFEGENGPVHDRPGHVQRSIYSKRLSRGQNRYSADADGGAHWRNLANAVEPSVCGSDAALRQITLSTCYFLANVNSRSRSLYAIARPSVVCLSVVCRLPVCNVRAPYSGGSDFRQYFYGIRYLGHPWTSTENFTEIVPGEPFRRLS